MRRLALALAGVASIAALTGCNQIAQLQPVAGDGVTSVRIATIDVLTDNNIAVKVAPVCTYEGLNYSCNGTTVDGQPIVATGVQTPSADVPQDYSDNIENNSMSASSYITLTVQVGNDVLYQGIVNQVIAENARTAS